ncbi:MAG: hypothetical protein U0790_27280 [Isosphaeraceae bacterium]
MIPKRHTPGQQPAREIKLAEFAETAAHDSQEDEPGDLHLIERGAELFGFLVEQANRGDSLGVGYAQFACLVHGVDEFREIFDRAFCQADVSYVLSLAHRVTAAAGRKRVEKNGVVLHVGMDTFIWRSRSPHPRPSRAFKDTPYTEEEWKRAFPDGTRHLHECVKCAKLGRKSCICNKGKQS